MTYTKAAGLFALTSSPMYIKAALNEMKIWRFSGRGRHRLGLCWFRLQHLAKVKKKIKKKNIETDFRGIRNELKMKIHLGYMYAIKPCLQCRLFPLDISGVSLGTNKGGLWNRRCREK